MDSVIQAAKIFGHYKNYNIKLYNKLFKFYQNKYSNNKFKIILLSTNPYNQNRTLHFQQDLLLLTLTDNKSNEKKLYIYTGDKYNIFVCKNYNDIDESISDILLETCQNKYISAQFTNYKIIDINKFNSTLKLLSFI